jgi:hypothetical protein
LLEPDKRPEARRRGFISRHRRAIAAASLMLAAMALAPASASAGSLLSGYGGPGEGNQAILGSALLGGPPGAGGAGGEAGSGSLAQGSTAAATGGEAAPGARGGNAASGAAVDRRRHSRGPANGAPAAPPARPSGGGRSSGNIDVPSTEVLSTADLEYILLALAALAATGVLTRRLADHPRQTTRGR